MASETLPLAATICHDTYNPWAKCLQTHNFSCLLSYSLFGPTCLVAEQSQGFVCQLLSLNGLLPSNESYVSME